MTRTERNAAAAAARGTRPGRIVGASPSPVSRNLALRSAPVAGAASPVRRTKARMTGAQRNSQGKRSEWAASPYYRTAVTIDSRWSK